MAYIESRIREFAREKGVGVKVSKIAGWIERASDGEYDGICGGTAVGKYYDTLILDITYQGSEISLQTDTGEIEFLSEPVSDYKSFKRVWDNEFYSE